MIFFYLFLFLYKSSPLYGISLARAKLLCNFNADRRIDDDTALDFWNNIIRFTVYDVSV